MNVLPTTNSIGPVFTLKVSFVSFSKILEVISKKYEKLGVKKL